MNSYQLGGLVDYLFEITYFFGVKLISMRIMVIEDNPVISWMLKNQLEILGAVDIRIYEDFFSAFVDLESYIPDLIITNLQALDGWIDSFDFNLLQKKSRYLLVITGLANSDLHPVVIDDSGAATGILYKPFSSPQLCRALQEIDFI
ncbi:MAG: hypothetical protein KDC53_02545 [Saprospiraceae bacterium]|nr:hypothetical protein [Saprospiraceae bacterium]